MASNLADHLRLMLVTDDRLLDDRDLLPLCVAAVRGGVTSVQLRLKRASARELVVAGRALIQAVRVPVIINDRPDVARIVGAGVHLGPEDLPVPLARAVVGPGVFIGASVGSVAEARAGAEADYWGVGPWRTTSTKADAGPSLGAPGFRELLALAGGRPCVAIGGVRPEDGPEILALGGAGVAVAAGILAAGDVEAAARRYAVGLGA